MSSLDYYTIAVIVLTSIILFIEVYSGYKEDKAELKKDLKDTTENKSKYIINVSTLHEDGGVSSHWHGWSDKWLFTYEEALEKTRQLEKLNLFDEIEMIEYESEQKKINEKVNHALHEGVNHALEDSIK